MRSRHKRRIKLARKTIEITTLETKWALKNSALGINKCSKESF
jgi:hypothetical protein